MAATETGSAAETEALAARLAARLRPGDVVLVSGELGAGKTTFVRGAARALGVTEPVTSPTFVVGHLYDAGVAHLDLYRLGGLDDEDPGLLDPYFGPELITFVEWPERAGHARVPPGARQLCPLRGSVARRGCRSRRGGGRLRRLGRGGRGLRGRRRGRRLLLVRERVGVLVVARALRRRGGRQQREHRARDGQRSTPTPHGPRG